VGLKRGIRLTKPDKSCSFIGFERKGNIKKKNFFYLQAVSKLKFQPYYITTLLPRMGEAGRGQGGREGD
jgi:hypothetical protein